MKKKRLVCVGRPLNSQKKTDHPDIPTNESKNIRSEIALFGLGVISILLVSCAMAPKRFETFDQGQWKAKVLVRDKKNFRSQIVNLDLNAVKNKKLRMDVTTPLGVHVASLVMNDNKVSYMLVRQKKYFSGPSNSRVLRPMISVPMDPKVLHNVLFDLPIAEKSWSCSKDSKSYLAECKNLRSGLKIKWTQRNGSQRVIEIDHKLARLQMNLKNFYNHTEKKKSLFTLQPPKSFKKYRIR